VACTSLSPIIEAALVKLRFSRTRATASQLTTIESAKLAPPARSALTPNKVTTYVVAIRSFA